MKRKENALIKHGNLFKKYILTKLCLHWKYKTNLPFNINQCNSHQTEEENKINSIDRKKKIICQNQYLHGKKHLAVRNERKHS